MNKLIFCWKTWKKFRGVQKYNSRNKIQTASRSKKILQGAKNSYETLTNENKQLKEYIVKIKQQYKQQHNKNNIFYRNKNILLQKDIKSGV